MTLTSGIRTEIKPRLAFLGTGWIGLNRMKALLEKDICIAAGICDQVPENARLAKEAAESATLYTSYDELLDSRPDGIVIATPNAFHYSQCIEALNKGMAVFCQKPLARTATESREIINAAGRADRLLGIDMSYRYTDGMQKIKELVQHDELGEVFAADLIFHNAYGPDKDWFYNPRLSGGGCVLDLGIHLVDLALWILNFPAINQVESALFSGGKRINDSSETSEDFAAVHIITETGAVVRLTCSWNLPAGKDAEIKAAFYGTKASAVFENINGSFYDFEAFVNHGTSRRVISQPPDDWGGKALVSWVHNLQKSAAFDEQIKSYIKVAEVIDRIYGRNTAH